MLDLKDSKMLLDVQKRGCLDCFIPSRYRDEVAHENELDRLGAKINDETMKPFVNSGHAFVCFDSVNSLNLILKHFRITPTQHIKIFLVGIKNKLNSFFEIITRSN